jgi:hypothetical protein
MSVKFQIVLLTVFLFFIALSCSNKCEVEGIEVSELLVTSSGEKGVKYCDLLSESLRGDENAILGLSLLEFSNSTGYDHGSVLVDLILKIGEEKYIQAISQTNREQKILIQSYLDVGLQYGNDSSIKSKNLTKAFPNLYSVLQ